MTREAKDILQEEKHEKNSSLSKRKQLFIS